MNAAELASLTRFAIGLEDLFFADHDSASKFPPHEVIERDEHYELRLAVAGYSRDRLSVTLEKNQLTIQGKPEDEAQKGRVVHSGLANRAFARKFLVSDGLEFEDAKLADGMLSIVFKRKRVEPTRKLLPIR
jgi:HSP20 family molecular chaperone IbpA